MHHLFRLSLFNVFQGSFIAFVGVRISRVIGRAEAQVMMMWQRLFRMLGLGRATPDDADANGVSSMASSERRERRGPSFNAARDRSRMFSPQRVLFVAFAFSPPVRRRVRTACCDE